MKQIFTLILSIALLSACSTQNIPVAMDRFVDKAEQNGDKYSESDWEQSKEDFEKLIEDYTNSDRKYTQAEKEMAANAIGRYHALVLKQGFSKAQEYLQSLGKIIPEYLNGFATELENHSEGLIKSIESIIDTSSIESSLEKIGSALENLFGTSEEEEETETDI